MRILGAGYWGNLVHKQDSALREIKKWWYRRYFVRNDSDGDLNLFNVKCNDDGHWLNANYGKPDNFWNTDDRFVFVRRQSSHFSPSFY
jgi:hypothetical protein